MTDAVVVGAGVGGLSSAIAMAASGLRVTVLEAADEAGGKAGRSEFDGVRFDTGPSLLTLPDTVRNTLRLASDTIADALPLRRLSPGFRYIFDDGVVVDMEHSAQESIASVGRALGSGAASDFSAFLDYAERIWSAAAPHFIYGEAPTLGGVLGMGPRTWAKLAHIDASRSMWAAICSRVQSPHLRAILARYATYNGSDPRLAPATLNCIAHVELGLGGYGVAGGLSTVVELLLEAARSLGVAFQFGARVTGIRLATDRSRRVTGVDIAGQGVLEADRVVVNADATHLFEALLPVEAGVPTPKGLGTTPSMSGYTAVFRAKPVARRAPHTVLMHSPYIEEFEDVFDHGRPPQHPTVYLCDQHASHDVGRWGERVPLFMMANAPAEPVDGSSSPDTWRRLRERMQARAVDAGLLEPSDEVVWERTPRDLASRFFGSRGSLYGSASNSMWSAFRRPRNQVPGTAGLFLATGSAHPGGGVPLAVLSGRQAARHALNYRP